MNNNVLALDLGTHTGWARTINNGQIVHGVDVFANNRFSGGGMRYLNFHRWLNEIHACCPVSEVVYEEVRRHAGTTAAHVYGGFLATLTAFCEEQKIPYQSVTVQAIKKYWTGKGNANKQAMIDKAVEMGFQITDDNEADAIAILHLQLKKITDAKLISLSD